MPALADVTQAVQHLLLDRAGSILTDSYQLVYQNIVWRKLQRAMEETGFLDVVATTEIYNVPAIKTSLANGGNSELPDRAIRAHRMEERPSTGGEWALMSYCKYHMPVLPAAATRDVWTWENNRIEMNAGVVANDFRIRHTQYFDDLVSGQGIPLTEVREALIFGTAALIARARGVRAAALDYNAQYENEAKKIFGRDSLSEFAKLLEFEAEEDSA